MIRYKLKKKRNWKIPFFFFLILLTAIAAINLLQKDFKSSPIAESINFSKSDMQYYVPVTGYFSARKNITKGELIKLAQEGGLFVEEGQKKNLKSIFGTGMDARDYDGEALGEQVAIVRFNEVSGQQKTLSYEGKYLWDKNDVKDYGLKAEVAGAQKFELQKLTKITMLGDVMLSRHVNTQIKKFGFDFPWLKTKDRTADADITFANLEVPISDLRPAPAEGMSFIAPTKNLPFIKSAGIDVVSVANNHTANFGWKVFEDNLKNLKESKTGICGGGENEAEARKPVIIEKNGLKFGFLCYNSIVGGLAAKGSGSGVATIEIEPWYRDSNTDIEKMKSDIRAAKKLADIVIVSPHWGVEYKVNPNASQRKVAKAALGAGADMIVGTHPHVVQGAEWSAGKYINYSLGNFIFDQEWSTETTEGVVLESYFYGNKLVAANLVPIKIKNYAQPSFVEGLGVLARIAKASVGF